MNSEQITGNSSSDKSNAVLNLLKKIKVSVNFSGLTDDEVSDHFYHLKWKEVNVLIAKPKKHWKVAFSFYEKITLTLSTRKEALIL